MPARRRADGAALQALLDGCSRTFALAIPSLPEPLRREVTVAYLLCRVLDTIEDASHWERRRRTTALATLPRLLDRPSGNAAGRFVRELSGGRVATESGCRRLVVALPRVLAAHAELSPASREIVASGLRRMADGMARFVSRIDRTGELRVVSLDELREYCYVVAGVVGELLTELFIAEVPALAPVAGSLRRRGARFGEGLQLVNIVRDAHVDAKAGRHFLPEGLDTSRVVSLARRDLDVAAQYVRLARGAGAPRGVIAFTALPVALARATLDGVLRSGPGAKVSRSELTAIRERVGLSALSEAAAPSCRGRRSRGAPAGSARIGAAPPRRVSPRATAMPPRTERPERPLRARGRGR